MAAIYLQIVELFIRTLKIQSHIDIFPFFVLSFLFDQTKSTILLHVSSFSTFPDPNDPDYVYFTTFYPSTPHFFCCNNFVCLSRIRVWVGKSQRKMFARQIFAFETRLVFLGMMNNVVEGKIEDEDTRMLCGSDDGSYRVLGDEAKQTMWENRSWLKKKIVFLRKFRRRYLPNFLAASSWSFVVEKVDFCAIKC